MSIPNLNTLIKKSRKDHSFITSENLFFNPDTQMDYSILCLFLQEKEENGITFFDKPQKLAKYYDKFDNNLLHMAEVSNDRQLAYWLITYAPELMHEKNQFGHYPAHFAAANHLGLQKYPTEFLIKTVAEYHHNMLHLAADFGSTSNVLWLLERSDLIDKNNRFEGPALHCALNIYSSNISLNIRKVKTAKLLLSHMDEKQRKKQLQHKSAFGLCPNDYIELYLKPAERALLQDVL